MLNNHHVIVSVLNQNFGFRSSPCMGWPYPQGVCSTDLHSLRTVGRVRGWTHIRVEEPGAKVIDDHAWVVRHSFMVPALLANVSRCGTHDGRTMG